LHKEFVEDKMDQLKHTHESRYLSILIGDVLRWGVDNRARLIAAKRKADKIAPEDIVQATKEFLAENLNDLPRLIEQAIEEHHRDICKAA
jgi:hypothetical protein